jgi:molybdate transport system substrate-binding protein
METDMTSIQKACAVVLVAAVLSVTATSSAISADAPQTLTIAAANSLKDALRAVLPLFEQQHGSVGVRVVWGPSQTLREQIEQGAPVDVFLPSSIEEIGELEKKGLTLQGTKQVYAETSLVLITQAALPVALESLKDLAASRVRRIAIGNPRTSSVGKFAQQALKAAGLEDRLRPRYVTAEHSGAVLDLVAAGEADIGLVYRADAFRQPKVRIIADVAPDLHNPIIYGLATVWTAKNPFLAQRFRQFMLSERVQGILKSYGFERASGSLAYR